MKQEFQRAWISAFLVVKLFFLRIQEAITNNDELVQLLIDLIQLRAPFQILVEIISALFLKATADRGL